MVISQGDVWWADLPAARGAGPGYRRPLIVIQCDSLNRSRLDTVLCVPLTSNLKWIDAPGNVFLATTATDLPKDSVAATTQTLAVDRTALTERVGSIAKTDLHRLFAGLDTVLGR